VNSKEHQEELIDAKIELTQLRREAAKTEASLETALATLKVRFFVCCQPGTANTYSFCKGGVGGLVINT
jgi:hypothetical protein